MKITTAVPKFYRPFFSLKSGLIAWWLGTQPMFAVCLDCDGKRWPPVKGFTSHHFATVMHGRVTGRWFTGAGTCVRCYTDGAWLNAFHRAPEIEEINTQPEPEKTCSICDGLHTGYCPVEDDGQWL